MKKDTISIIENKIKELEEKDQRLTINFNRDNDIARAKFEAEQDANLDQRYFLKGLLED